MKKLSVSETREAFLKFFEGKGCTREKSSSLVPLNDPTLLFTSAGMVQFKDVFTGIEKRPYTRATTAQKCLRAGGKHNDLENVGFTARHNTFFEMLGNFSFGDYFKKEAIAWAWELVTEVYGLPKDKLHVTVFREDDEAYDIWHKNVGIPKERIYRFGEKDNFWSAGDVGPCGPCTEIYIDRGESFNTGDPEMDKMGGDGGRYLEFYNLVFMQYNRDSGGHLSNLPKPSVDTGMGLERMASILQNVPSNYDVDVFQTIIKAISSQCGASYTSDLNDEPSSAMRVIADHLRAVSFLVTDGVTPSNEGRGYVQRRILRRAVYFGTTLGFQGPFLYRYVPYLVQSMSDTYPELKTKQKTIEKEIQAEEERFFTSIERGKKVFDAELEQLKKKKSKTFSGEVAFLLQDSFGYPIDLTVVACRKLGLDVDMKKYEELMDKQRAQSRGAEAETDTSSQAVYTELGKDKKLATTQFEGYENFEGKGKILAVIADGKRVGEAKGGLAEIVFDKTPFYAEGGGQVGDKGEIWAGGKLAGHVLDVKKPLPQLSITKVKLETDASLKEGAQVEMRVSRPLRMRTMANHTATHLLHWALRKKLGTHVKQSGSLVNPDLLRFDFTHPKAMTEEERASVEAMINEKIAEGGDVSPKEMTKDEAISAGAMALFGEKYGDTVRTLKIGDGYSFELCGGTHVTNTAEIGCLVIESESGIAAGVRRIVAYTGVTAFNFLKAKADVTDKLRDRFKSPNNEDVLVRVDKLQSRAAELEKKLSGIQAESAGSLAKELVAKATTLKGVKVVTHTLKEGGNEALRTLGERLRDHLPSGVIALGAADPGQGKAFLQVLVSPDLTKTYNAGKLIQASAPLIEGKGGGKPEQAQAGGTKIAGLEPAIEHIVSLLGSAQ
ncbi:MAG TPA: alanine--tRNA ligase [Bdellovibrionota bacterium]|jgi:alanyl-tRNA synthetase